MSSTFSVYAVSFDRLRRVPGSRDRALIEAIATTHEDFFAQIDELADSEEEVPTCREALEQLVEGSPLADHLGHLYGYALEAVCAHLGRELDGVPAISGASGWIDPVDAFLREKGVPITLTDLVFGASPVDLPTPDDHPYIGSWPPESIPTALAAIRGVDTAGLDFETAETVDLIRGWLEAAASEPGAGLVGVLS